MTCFLNKVRLVREDRSQFYCNASPTSSICVSLFSDLASAKPGTFRVAARSAQPPLIPWNILFSLPWRCGWKLFCPDQTFLSRRGTRDQSIAGGRSCERHNSELKAYNWTWVPEIPSEEGIISFFLWRLDLGWLSQQSTAQMGTKK